MGHVAQRPSDPALPGPEGVVVTVEATAICGSDLHLYHDAPTGAGIELGHEAVGTVAEAGVHVRNLKTGDRVLVSGVIGCGLCGPCRAGAAACLPRLLGSRLRSAPCPTSPADKPKRWPCRSPTCSRCPSPKACPTRRPCSSPTSSPRGTSVRCRADILPGATVVIVGLGPVGIMALRCAAPVGPARILAVDVVPERLARAERLGAEPIDARVAPGSAQVLEATGGLGSRVGHRGGGRGRQRSARPWPVPPRAAPSRSSG